MRRQISFPAVALILTGFFFSDAFAAEDAAQKPAELTREKVEFFETNIRPVLVERCYECHSSQAKKLKGGLLLDSQKGVAAGGDNGPILMAGEIERSPLIQAIRWTDP